MLRCNIKRTIASAFPATTLASRVGSPIEWKAMQNYDKKTASQKKKPKVKWKWNENEVEWSETPQKVQWSEVRLDNCSEVPVAVLPHGGEILPKSAEYLLLAFSMEIKVSDFSVFVNELPENMCLAFACLLQFFLELR